MKVGFYAIYTKEVKTKKKHSIDLYSIFQKNIIEKKEHLEAINDYFVFVHHINKECFLITKTDDSQLVKKINKKTLSIEEIKNVLSRDESLCYPSFLLIKDNIIGFANTRYGPRTKDLINYISNKIKANKDTSVVVEPLVRNVTKVEALRMDFIGRTTLRAENGSHLIGDVLRLLGVNTIEEELLSGIEITIKPKKFRNIKIMSKEIINNTDENHSDIRLKAKEQAADILTDFYLSEKGHLSAKINKFSSEEIAEEIEACFINMEPAIIKSYKDYFENEFEE